jgi:nicotinate dehydrogenase medium molybdopterin subunit
MAALDARKQILRLASEQLHAEDLEVKEKKVFVKGQPDRFVHFKDVLGGSMYKKGGPVIGKASINPEAAEMDPKTIQGAASRFFSTYTFATNIVEIEIDPGSGEISIIRAVGSNDCGTVINPDGAEGQMDGGMAIALGYGLYEEIQIKDGQVLNPSFLEYKIPTAMDVPAFSRVIVENYDDNGPFGAKGIANSSVVNMAPAIANAVFTLTGIRLRELPVLPEKILDQMAASVKK